MPDPVPSATPVTHQLNYLLVTYGVGFVRSSTLSTVINLCFLKLHVLVQTLLWALNIYYFTKSYNNIYLFHTFKRTCFILELCLFFGKKAAISQLLTEICDAVEKNGTKRLRYCLLCVLVSLVISFAGFFVMYTISLQFFNFELTDALYHYGCSSSFVYFVFVMTNIAEAYSDTFNHLVMAFYVFCSFAVKEMVKKGTKRLEYSLTDLITSGDSGDFSQQIDTLLKMLRLKSKLNSSLSFFPLIWFAYSFVDTVMRLLSNGSSLRKSVIIFRYGFYALRTSFLVVTVICVDVLYIKENNYFTSLELSLIKQKREKNNITIKTLFLFMSIKNVLRKLSNCRPLLGSIMNLDCSLVLCFFGSSIPFAVLLKDLMMKTQ